MSRSGVMIYFGDFHIISSLSDAELGAVYRAALDYAEYGVIPEFADDGRLRIAWESVRAAVDRDKDAYDQKCLRSEYATYCRTQKANNEEKLSYNDWTRARNDSIQHRNDIVSNTNTSSSSSSSSRSKYIYNSLSPTREEIMAYVAERGYHFNADKFYNTYEATGWKKNGEKIDNWKALADNWELSERQRVQRKPDRQSGIQQHREPVSPMMREAVRKMLEEEDGEK